MPAIDLAGCSFLGDPNCPGDLNSRPFITQSLIFTIPPDATELSYLGLDHSHIRRQLHLLLCFGYSPPTSARRVSLPLKAAADRCGHDPVTLLRNYAKRTRKAGASAASIIGNISKGILGN